MAKGECVIIWRIDPAVPGSMNLRPVTCGQVIEMYKAVLGKLARQEELSDSDIRIIAAAAEGVDCAATH